MHVQIEHLKLVFRLSCNSINYFVGCGHVVASYAKCVVSLNQSNSYIGCIFYMYILVVNVYIIKFESIQSDYSNIVCVVRIYISHVLTCSIYYTKHVLLLFVYFVSSNLVCFLLNQWINLSHISLTLPDTLAVYVVLYYT